MLNARRGISDAETGVWIAKTHEYGGPEWGVDRVRDEVGGNRHSS